MLTREQAQELVGKVIKLADAEQIEIIVTSGNVNSTRFSGNVIRENVGLLNNSIRLRVINGKRQGTASINQLDDESIKRGIASAIAVARVSAEDDKLLPMLKEQPEYAASNAWFEETAAATPALRAEAVGKVLSNYSSRGIEGAGIFDTHEGCVAYGNSHGVFAYHPSSKADFTVSAFLDNGNVEGWAESSNMDIAKIDYIDAGLRAAAKCEAGQNPIALETGDMPVILEPAALTEAMLFWGWLTGNGLAFAEGRSFHRGELGQAILDSKLTISEDPLHSELGGRPFDMEGFASQPVKLVDAGKVVGVVHDRRSAALVDATNTGHANIQPDAGGPRPSNIVVATGDKTVEQMIADTERGLLVTKFHYTNVVNAQEVSMTGLTRAGTFLIENGKVSKPVQNMRFTQSLLTAFKDIDSIGREAHASGGALFGGNFVVPAMKLKHWKFSSPTGF
ncbi:MAG: TldD/PmbA family protein [Planctomycetes bacterium]|nr:TldD/PmbA family protein [Planctomycetota bacterium]